jgi:death on curing protein
VQYLTKKQILLIHSMIIDETGGVHGIRDNNALLGIENAPKQRVFGKEVYSTTCTKAAVYARDIIMNHPFIDGNKRTGMTSAIVFLENNNYVLAITEGEIEVTARAIIQKRWTIEDIAGWLQKHSKKIR